MHTVPETAKPFVHLISMPESIDVCFTGNENANPISLFLPGEIWNLPSSFDANFASSKAMKSNSSCSETQDLFDEKKKSDQYKKS